jgi:hypothetical protein
VLVDTKSDLCFDFLQSTVYIWKFYFIFLPVSKARTNKLCILRQCKYIKEEKLIPIFWTLHRFKWKIGIYDRRIMCLSRKQQIIHTFEYSKPYIEEIRKRLNNRCLFENLEWFSTCLLKPWYYRLTCKITQFFRCRHNLEDYRRTKKCTFTKA